MSRVVFLARRPAGGLGDRYVGLVTAVQLARALNRKLEVAWEDGGLDGIISYPIAGDITGGVHLDARDRQVQDSAWWSSVDIEAELAHNPTILLRCNVALGQYLWRNPHYAGWLGVYDPISDYRTAFREIMRPSQALVDTCRTVIAEREVSWGIQVRMGDTYIPGPFAGYVSVNPTKLQTMLTEARDLIPRDAGVFITGDSPLVWEAAQDILADYRTTYLNKPLIHTDKSKPIPMGMLKAFVDMHVLSMLPNLIITTASNFGRVPAVVGDAELFGWTGHKVEPIKRRDMLSKKEVL